MKLIVGLGNPGKKYESSRHNAGFKVVDELAEQLDIQMDQIKFKGLIGEGRKGSHRIILLKPLTYMNLSGESISQVVQFYKLELADVLVIYDDLDTAVGGIRLRLKGSSGGHNGMKSTIQHVSSEQFCRIRVGIGRPPQGRKIVDYVLGTFLKEELGDLDAAIKKSADAALAWLEEPFEQVMNQFNS